MGIVLGATLLGAAGLQIAGATYVKRRRLRFAQAGSARRQRAFHEQMTAAMQWARAAKPMFKAWANLRSFRVAAIVDEAVDCKSYYLMPVDGHPLPRFEPGQFLTFSLPVDPRQKPLVRCYSLSDRPHEDYLRITIKHALPPANSASAPPGVGSSYFHQRVKVGSTLEAQAPLGSFFLNPTDDRPVVLIGAGIGITPILSMVNTIAHERSEQEAYMFGGFGNSSEHPFRQHLQEIAAEHDNIKIDVSYSRPMPADKIGREYQHRGYVDVARLKQILPSNNFRFYICGPPSMMQTLVPALQAWGIPDSHIHFEAFGPASVKSLNQVRSTADIAAGPCQVEFLLAHACLDWDGGYTSLLEFAESQGVPLDYGCRAGNCGQCLVSVKEGNVTHVKEPGLPLDANQCLTCIGVPSGNVVLEA